MNAQAKAFLFIAASALFAHSHLAYAGDVQVQMQAFIVSVDDEGKEQFAAAEIAEPGQVVEYRLFCKNEGEKSVRGWAVTGPIPASTEYVTNSAQTQIKSELRVSIDGGKTWSAEPVMREVKKPDGTTESVVVPPSEYSHLRWFAKERLGIDEVQQYFYRVRVLSDE